MIIWKSAEALGNGKGCEALLFENQECSSKLDHPTQEATLSPLPETWSLGDPLEYNQTHNQHPAPDTQCGTPTTQ